MVSHQANGWLSETMIDQPIKHAFGIRTTVDVVAEKDGNRVRYWMHALMFLDPCENRVQQIQTSVDVSNCINSSALGHARCSNW